MIFPPPLLPSTKVRNMMTASFRNHYSFLPGLSTDRPCKRRLDRKPDPRYGDYQENQFKDQLMEEYKQRLAIILAERGALFFGRNLVLKEGRPTPCYMNIHMLQDRLTQQRDGHFFCGYDCPPWS
jgi:hypothetical protein